MASSKLVIFGGHGKVAQHFTKAVASRFAVESVIRDSKQSEQISSLGAKPVVLSLEDGNVQDFARAIDGAKYVVWSAGAGGKGGPDRTTTVDHLAAVKVFDAIESLATKPRLLVVSAIDVRDTDKPYPSHYTDADKERSTKARSSGNMAHYYAMKANADRDLSRRTSFSWTILKPGLLLDDPGTGKVSLGRTRLQPGVPREDVAAVLVALLEREDANGKAFDLIGGETPIADAVDRAISSGESDLFV